MAENYLGETPFDQKDTPFAAYTPADWAMVFIERYGQIDGEHHKQWVLDQVVRILKGCPVIIKQARWTDHPPEWRFNVGEETAEYKEWRDEMLGATEKDGSREYSYDEGTPP
jgi:hypothetical protein